MKIMLDTNVFDRIAATEGLVAMLNRRSKAGELTILTTPVQEEELAGLPDPVRRKAAQRLERVVVPVAGSPTGEPGQEAPPARPGSPLMPSARHRRDALIGATVALAADMLVTEDVAFARRVRALGAPCRVVSFAQFQQWVTNENGTPDS